MHGSCKGDNEGEGRWEGERGIRTRHVGITIDIRECGMICYKDSFHSIGETLAAVQSFG